MKNTYYEEQDEPVWLKAWLRQFCTQESKVCVEAAEDDVLDWALAPMARRVVRVIATAYIVITLIN